MNGGDAEDALAALMTRRSALQVQPEAKGRKALCLWIPAGFVCRRIGDHR